MLTQQITMSIPELTIHDVSHLDALWEIADIIAGPDYPLNPLEGFVLGGAFLLHDAALCFEAYAGGRAGLRDTIQWKDCFELERQRFPLESEMVLERKADFYALRALHAHQAAELGTGAWKDGNNELFLIDNYHLRQSYGSLTGRIAASHHWSIEQVRREFSSQVNATPDFPREWRVDPIKIACLLRCADAAHIDSRRAPDFLIALERRQGVSEQHWRAQNWLARCDVDQESAGDCLVFTSTKAFDTEHTDAWWIAYDAVCLIDAEIKAANDLLLSRPQCAFSPPFKIKGINGAGSPEKLAKYVRVNGWKPCSANIHVSNIGNLIATLGGKRLYAPKDDFHALGIALRELIQNARDAISARQVFCRDYEGKITVRCRRLVTGQLVIEIEDDGIGMSEAVLTGNLLDFGVSFWISNLVNSEFPGLTSSKFRAVGRFGIGFYSVFMIAKRVTVSSRRWDNGMNEVRTLTFINGLTLRPTLAVGRPDDFGGYTSTKVTCYLQARFSDLDNIKISNFRAGSPELSVSFVDYVGALVAGLDVSVVCENDEKKQLRIHAPINSVNTDEEKRNWLSTISFQRYRNGMNSCTMYAGRLRHIREGEQLFGLAALPVTPGSPEEWLSAQTVGGLVASIDFRNSYHYVGYFDYEPASARRDADTKPKVPPHILKAWAKDQIEILKAGDTADIEWCFATYSICEFDLDPLPIGKTIIVCRGSIRIVNLRDLAEIVCEKGIAVFSSPVIRFIDLHSELTEYGDVPTFMPITYGSFLNIEMYEDKPKNPNSFLGCLYRSVAEKDLALIVEKIHCVAKSVTGSADVLIFRAARRS